MRHEALRHRCPGELSDASLAQDMTAQDVTIRTSGSSDIETCVTGVLDVSTSGSGDVTYYCDPAKINANTSGSGNIRQGR